MSADTRTGGSGFTDLMYDVAAPGATDRAGRARGVELDRALVMMRGWRVVGEASDVAAADPNTTERTPR